MFTPTEQFITQMKFSELRAQREKALKACDALERELTNAKEDAERLRLLYRGLRNLTFAKQPLHPDVANLEPLLRELDTGQASSETVSFWNAQLARELACGRMCAEIVYIFGALLEERSLDSAQDTGREQERLQAQEMLLSRLSATPQRPESASFTAQIFEELQLPTGDAQAAHVRKVVEEVIYSNTFAYATTGEGELETALKRIQTDVYRSGAISWGPRPLAAANSRRDVPVAEGVW
jgi:hypothetical protein